MRLEHKIVLIILATLTLSFVVLIWFNVRREAGTMTRLHSQGSDLAIGALVAGIRNVMLAGEGPYAREIVDEIRRNPSLEITDLKVYNKDGAEVYQYVDFDRLAAPQPDSAALAVINALRSGAGSEKTVSASIDGRHAEVRIVGFKTDSLQRKIGAMKLALELEPMMHLVGEDLYNQVTHVPGEAIVQGYKTIMLSGKAENMSTYAAASGRLPGVVSLQVFDNEGNKTKFGDNNLPIDQDLFFYLSEALGNVWVGYTERRDPTIYTQLFPLENEPRCYACHGRDHLMRGVIRLSIRTTRLDNPAGAMRFAGDMAQAAIANTVRSVVRFGGKDIFVRDYVRSLEQLPEVLQLTLYNPDGEEIRLDKTATSKPDHEDLVRQVLESVKPVHLVEDHGADGRFLTDYVPIKNGVQCWQCHSSDHKVRAVIEIRRSLADIDRLISNSRLFAIVAGILTIIVIWLALNILMRQVVVRPVNEIVRVVSEVGSGNLQARVRVANKDEIGLLGREINRMIAGLTKKFHLEKFVSKATVEAVDHAGQVGVRLGGVRREIVVLFSDIRSFTAFSERIAPEQVVNMLNVYLRAQAKIVNAHGGQIDKYVGDELVALFFDDAHLVRAADRALNCAKQIQRILHKLRETGKVPKVDVGIGINVGSAVMGAIGTEERMDYTVIGDTVNVGARLCAAAKPGQIIVSEPVRDMLRQDKRNRHQFEPLAPMQFKGKARPIPVYEVVYTVEGEPRPRAEAEDENGSKPDMPA